MKAAVKRLARTRYALAWRRAWQRVFGWRWFRGDYGSWAEARAASAGYDDGAVWQRVRAATRAVRAGEAAWERDGTTFAEPAAPGPLVAVLRGIAAERGGRLDVVDFGGALGSTWWQQRAALADLAVRWCVVEQVEFVAAGRAEFTGEGLSFEPTLAAAGAAVRPAVILFSSVLPYVDRPQELLAEAGFGPENPLKITLNYNTSEAHQKMPVLKGLACQKRGKPVPFTHAHAREHTDKMHLADGTAGYLRFGPIDKNIMFL